MDEVRPRSRRRVVRLVAAAWCAVLAASAAAAPATPSRDEADAFLRRVEQAFAAEDLASLRALHVGSLTPLVDKETTGLFRERNYFTLEHEVVSTAPREDGSLVVEVVARLRSRHVSADEDTWEKRRWIFVLSRRPDGSVVAVESKVAPRRLLPAAAPWRPEDWTGTVEILPRRGRLGTPEGRVTADLVARLRNVSPDEARQLAFALHPGVLALSADVAGVPLALERSHAEVDTWWAELPAPVPPGGALALHVAYSLDVIGGSPHAEVGEKGAALFADAGWHPWFTTPRPDNPLRASHDLTLVVPAGWTALAPGKLAEKGTTTAGRASARWFSRLPGADLAVVAGPLVAEERALANGTLRVFRPQGSDGLAIAELAAHLVRMAAFEEGVVGPLPLDEITLVEAPGSGMHSAPGFFAVSSFVPRTRLSLLADAEARIARSDREHALHFLAHHLAHLWFVDAMTPQGPGAIALTEGLCDHVASAWYGQDVDSGGPAALRGEVLDAAAAHAELDGPLAEATTLMPEADVFGRGKAMVVLDMYRAFAGEARWRQALSSYFEQGRGRPVTMADFLRALAGDDPRLQEFCGAWILGRGFAQFRVADVRRTADGRGAEVVVVNDGQGPLRLRVAATVASQRRVEEVDVSADSTTILTMDGESPNRIDLDPSFLCWQVVFDDDTWPPGAGRKKRNLDPAKETRPRWVGEAAKVSGSAAREPP